MSRGQGWERIVSGRRLWLIGHATLGTREPVVGTAGLAGTKDEREAVRRAGTHTPTADVLRWPVTSAGLSDPLSSHCSSGVPCTQPPNRA